MAYVPVRCRCPSPAAGIRKCRSMPSGPASMVSVADTRAGNLQGLDWEARGVPQSGLDQITDNMDGAIDQIIPGTLDTRAAHHQVAILGTANGPYIAVN